MHVLGVCICLTYADAMHMDMLYISILISFPGQIRKKAVPDLPEPLRRAAAKKHNMCHSFS